MKICAQLVWTFLGLFLLTGCAHEATTPTATSNKPAATSNAPAKAMVDINSAAKGDLEALPGIGEAYAQRIIDHRPYREKTDLVRLKIIPDSTYQTISDRIIAHHKQ